MPKTLLALVAGAGLGLAGLVAVADLRPAPKLVSDLTQSLAAGVILGSGVWPYGLSSVPPDLQSTLLRQSPDCDPQGQCGIYRLASSTFINWRPDSDDTE
jgi:hypothetical protein